MNEIQRRFNYTRPSRDKQATMAKIRSYTRRLAKEYQELLPDSREKQRAIDALDDALLQAIASIAREDRGDGVG